jgi:hypothetical protein
MPDVTPSMVRKGYYDAQGNWVEPMPLTVNPDVPDRNDRGSSMWKLPEPDTTIYDYPPNSTAGDYGTEDPQLQPPDVLLRKYLQKKLDANQRREGYINEYRPERAANKADDVNSLGSALMKSAAQVGTLFGKRADATPVEDMASDMRRTGGATVADFYAQEKERGDRRNATIISAKDAIAGEDTDPASEESILFRNRVKQAFPDVVKKIENFDSLSASQLKAVFPSFAKEMTKDNPARLQLERDRMAQKDKLENRRLDIMEKGKIATLNRATEKDLKRDRERREAKAERGDKFAFERQKYADEKAAKDKLAGEKVEEAGYRYKTLKGNTAKLRDLVEKNGTMDLFGAEGTAMDRLIFEMAIDYAKLVDPDSVAREGEVAAAQKYMLPIRKYGGAGMTNATAQQVINDYEQSLDDRLKARQSSKAGAPKEEPIINTGPEPEKTKPTDYEQMTPRQKLEWHRMMRKQVAPRGQ